MSSKKKDKLLLEARDLYLKSDTDVSTGAQHYNLTEEFTSTRRNYNLRISFGLIIMITASAAVAFGLTSMMRRNADEMQVEVQLMDELDLNALMDRAARVRADIILKENSLTILNEERDRALSNLNEKYLHDQKIIESADMEPQAEQNALKMAAESFYNERNSLIEDYGLRSDTLNLELEALKASTEPGAERGETAELTEEQQQREQLIEYEKNQIIADYELKYRNLEKQFDQKALEEGRYMTAMFQNLNRRHNDEIAALILKYNPIAPAPQANLIREASQSREESVSTAGDDSSTGKPKDKEIDGGNIIDRAVHSLQMSQERRELEQQQEIISWLNSIPYTNSVQPALEATLQSQSRVMQFVEHKNEIIRSQQEEIRALRKELKEKEKTIKKIEKKIAPES